MLVLSRKVGETICIGDDIVITFVENKGGSIRLGIDAPKDVPIFRGEIIEQAIASGKPDPSKKPFRN